MPLGQWCTTNKDAIAAAGVAVTTVGFLATAIGLGMTVCQIKSTRNTLQATNAYQIQKDARELASKLRAEDLDAKDAPSLKLGEYMRGYVPDKFDKYDPAAAPQIAQVFNFYLAVYRQSKNAGVTKQFAQAFGTDFCGLYNLPGIRHYWNARVKSAAPPSQEMQEMKNAWCP